MIVIIPARLHSTRLPRKLLLGLNGKSVLERTFENAKNSNATRIIIAADDQEMIEHAQAFAPEVVLTKKTHVSGTDRLGETVEKLQLSDDEIIVNVQGDEPFLPPDYINKCAALLTDSDVRIATLACEVHEPKDAFFQPSAVKVVCDKDDHALYFSRASIPFARDGLSAVQTTRAAYLHHLGIYAYRAGFLRDYGALKESPLEHIEKLEQLRMLWHGYAIKVGRVSDMPAKGIDTEADLTAARAYLHSLDV